MEPTKEALELASDLRDIVDRLLIYARHLTNPSAHGPSADSMGHLATRLMLNSVEWEIHKTYRKVT